MLTIHANYNTCLTEFYHNICNLLYFELCHFGGFKTFGSHINDQSNELIPMIVWQNILMHFGKYSLSYNFKSDTLLDILYCLGNEFHLTYNMHLHHQTHVMCAY